MRNKSTNSLKNFSYLDPEVITPRTSSLLRKASDTPVIRIPNVAADVSLIDPRMLDLSSFFEGN